MHVVINTANINAREIPINDTAAQLVRLGFNPSESGTVEVIKALSAALISVCEDLRVDNITCGRHASLAITDIESAAMWAVKAATTAPETPDAKVRA